MKKQNSWIIFFPLWIIVNFIGWLLFSTIFLDFLKDIGILFIVPLLLCTFQFLVLRRFIGIASTWIWASYLVYEVFILLFVLLGPFLNLILFLLVEITVFYGLGWVQKKVLDFYINRTFLWPFVNAGAVLFATIFFLKNSNSLFTNGNFITFWIVFGLIYGIFTGIALIYMEKAGVSDSSIELKANS